MAEINYTEHVLEFIDRELETVNKEITKFTENLVLNPIYALEWANPVYTAAAAVQNQLINVRRAIESAQEKGLTEDEFNEFVRSIRRDLALELRHTGVSDSTSGSTRLLNVARAEAAAKWFEGSGRGLLNFETIEKALREHVKNQPCSDGCLFRSPVQEVSGTIYQCDECSSTYTLEEGGELIQASV